MNNSKEQEELSMREILVSIRKIISEDKEEPHADGDESAAEDVVEVVTDASYFLRAEKEGDAEEGALELSQTDGDESAAEDVVEVITDASYFLRAEKEGAAEEGALELTQMVSEDGTMVDLTKKAEEEAPQ
jgi:hypothetical protein